MRVIISFIILLCNSLCIGQTCMHKKLSEKYNYKTIRTRLKDSEGRDSSVVRLYIYRKDSNNLVQKIKVSPGYLFSDCYKSVTTTRSFITGFNEKKDVADFDYGDLIIVDLNFDGQEDIALKFDSGGNAGPTYNYYLWQNDSTFKFNKFLSNKMEFFPHKISVDRKILTTLVHANSTQFCESKFKLDVETGKWKRIGWKLINMK